MNVSVSRAQRILIFIDEKLPEWFSPVKETKFASDNDSIDLLDRIYSEKSSNEDYINFAQELEGRGLLIKAAENYFEGNDYINENRCRALYYEHHSSFLEAAHYYENAQMINDAVRCYEKNGNYGEAFRSILNFHSGNIQNEVENHLNNYINDMKKLAKLNNMGEHIAKAITNNEKIVDNKILFDYSLNRKRLLEYNIRLSEQAININISKDIKNRLLNIEESN